MEVKVSHQMNKALLSPYVATEVEEAVKQMNPSMAHGPDGMSPVFFQKY